MLPSSSLIRCYFVLCTLLPAVRSWAQIDVSNSPRVPAGIANSATADTTQTFWFWYENDLFAGTDRYYTQGVYTQVSHPAFRHLDIGGILTPGRTDKYAYSLRASLEAYTPSSIRSDSILRGDHPYAGLFYLSALSQSLNAGSRWWTGASLSLGLIGPVAGGEEIQTRIHRATDNFIPLGWQHQIRNDILLNYHYELGYRLSHSQGHLVSAFSKAYVGTLLDQACVGFSSDVYPLPMLKQFSLRLHTGVEGQVVAYDTKLQGGLFNRTSPYVISSNELSRLRAKGMVSITLSYRRVFIGANYSWRSREFSTGQGHKWGGVYTGFDF